MAAGTLSILAIFAALTGILYQTYLHPILLTFGLLNRTIEPLSTFPYTCHKLSHPLLQGCEDIYIDSPTHTLYAACQSLHDRHVWAPFISTFNFSARSSAGASLLSIDLSKLSQSGDNLEDALQQVLPHTSSNFQSVLGASDGTLDLLGFAGQRTVSPAKLLQLHLVNQRPFVNASTGSAIDHVDYDPSIEVFEEVPPSQISPEGPAFTHVATYSDPLIVRPNRVVSDGHGGLYMSNDHTNRASAPILSMTEAFMGGGGVVHCTDDPKQRCREVVGPVMYGPNGLTRTGTVSNGKVWVPATFEGVVHIFDQAKDGSLTEVETVKVGMPIDNLIPVGKGDSEEVWVAGLPSLIDCLGKLGKDGAGPWKSTALKIRKRKGGKGEDGKEYEVVKMLESDEAEVFGGVTSVAFDEKTKSIFSSGIQLPWVTVCRPKE